MGRALAAKQRNGSGYNTWSPLPWPQGSASLNRRRPTIIYHGLMHFIGLQVTCVQGVLCPCPRLCLTYLGCRRAGAPSPPDATRHLPLCICPEGSSLVTSVLTAFSPEAGFQHTLPPTPHLETMRMADTDVHLCLQYLSLKIRGSFMCKAVC